MSLKPSTRGHYLAFLFFFSSYIFTCQLVVGVLLTLANCIGDPYLLTILAYIKDYNPKLLVIIIIIIIIIIITRINTCVNTQAYLTWSSIYLKLTMLQCLIYTNVPLSSIKCNVLGFSTHSA